MSPVPRPGEDQGAETTSRRRFLQLLGVAGSGCVAGCGTGGSESGTASDEATSDLLLGTATETGPTVEPTWPLVHHDARNSGRSPGRGPTDDVSARWTYDAGARIRGSPVLGGDTVYVASRDATLHAIDAGRGTERWSYRGSEQNEVYVGAAVTERSVYFGERSGQTNRFYSLTLDGDVRWTHEFGFGSEVTAAPTVFGDVVSVGLGDSRVVALNRSTGSIAWSYDTGSTRAVAIGGPPAVADGTVYVGAPDGVHALSAADGSPEWQFDESSADTVAPTVADGTVYYVGESVYALSAADGSTEWTAPVPASGVRGPSVTVAEQTLYFGLGDHLYALSVTDGSERWRTRAMNPTGSAPTVVGGTVYVGGSDTLSALSTADGSTQWQYDTGARVNTTPAVVDGTVVVADDSGAVHAVSE